jgi:hypothetical protein
MPAHYVEVVLVVASRDKSGQYSYLMHDRDGELSLPAAGLGEQETTVDVAARLLKDLTGLKARLLGSGWVDLVPGPVADAADRKTAVPCNRLGGCMRKLVPPSDRCKCDERGMTTDGTPRTIAVPYGAVLPAAVAELTDPTLTWVPVADLFSKKFVGDHLDIIQALTTRL